MTLNGLLQILSSHFESLEAITVTSLTDMSPLTNGSSGLHLSLENSTRQRCIVHLLLICLQFCADLKSHSNHL